MTGNSVDIVAVDLSHEPTQVYSLEVNGSFTYFVDGIWVHNSNKVCELALAGHHLIPTFLGGWFNGQLRSLPPHFHQEYHGILRQQLAVEQIFLPENAGPHAWERLLEDYDTFVRARGALIRATEQFERSRGVSMISDLMAELKRQGWL